MLFLTTILWWTTLGRRMEPSRAFIPTETTNHCRSGYCLARKETHCLTHDAITWKILPDAEPEIQEEWKLQAQTLKEQLEEAGQPLPKVLFPQSAPRILIQAFLKNDNNNTAPVARFGITVDPGPSTESMVETARSAWGDSDDLQVVLAGAIVYMFVEPEHRGRKIASLALDVIAYLQAARGCTHTVLVADDNGSGKLIEWYECHGFVRAPRLQELLGSPNAIYGTTMMGRTKQVMYTVEWW